MNDYLLSNKTGKKLYQTIKDLPIIDYHCHLNAKDLFEDKPFDNITQMWLRNDHYKWRQMRIFGINEKFITGNANDKDKFFAYMKMLTYAIGQPLYAWSKMELNKYFFIECDIIEENFELIWLKCNDVIKKNAYSPLKLIEISNVEAVGIIEDITADIQFYTLLNNKVKGTTFYPIIRADRLLNDDIEVGYAKETFKFALDRFCKIGTLGADFSLETIDANNKPLLEKLQYMLSKCYEKNLVVQIHLSPIRNNNPFLTELLGNDCGVDSISDKNFLDGLLSIFKNFNIIGKTIIFNLNPAHNHIIASFCGNFANGGIKGKIQWGAAWWFNDNLDGLKEQLKTMSNLSQLSVFIGMLTDSRSVTSYVRHDYFRRILCDFIGEIVERNEFSSNDFVLEKIAVDVSYRNVKNYFMLKD